MKTAIILIRIFALATILTASAPAAIITLSATCTDAPATTTSFAAVCASPFGWASAVANPYEVATAAQSPTGVTQSSATLDADLSILLTGGTGTAYFEPCAAVSGDALATFGSLLITPASKTTCGTVRLAFGTPAVFHLHLESFATADSSEAVSYAIFQGGQVVTSAGRPIRGANVTFTDVTDPETPEPAPWILVALSLAIFQHWRPMPVRH